MKNNKEQIAEELDSLKTLISWNRHLSERVYKKWKRKEKWGILSFVFESKASLYKKYILLIFMTEEFLRFESENMSYED